MQWSIIQSERAHLILCACFLLTLLVLHSSLMIWVMVLAVCATMTRIFIAMGKYTHKPPPRTVNLMAILACLALAALSSSLQILDVMINLLVLAAALKLMLLAQQRDYYQMVCTLLFLIACCLVLSQTLVATAIALASMSLLLVGLSVNQAPAHTIRHQILTTLILIARALPIALVLFLFIPKLPPLWKMPSESGATTGLSDIVESGAIAQLAQSSDLVFIANFTSPVPPPSQRYWRALTLEAFNGEIWTRSSVRKQLERQYRHVTLPFNGSHTDAAIRYDVIAEPSSQTWLYSLDVPYVDQPSDHLVRVNSDYSVTARLPLSGKFFYQLSAFPHSPMMGAIASIDKGINLLIPNAHNNPVTRQWARELTQRYPDPISRLNGVISHFRRHDFHYTLSPPVVKGHSIDEFLFGHQQGFCVHYASAMAFSLRLMGIPARMVTGYLGGEEITPDTLVVRQYDAHAWVEAYIEQQGWVRFDPTAYVAPERINSNLDQLLAMQGESRQSQGLFSDSHSSAFAALKNWITSLEYNWGKWVLSYNNYSQKTLLSRLLGELSPAKLSWFFGAILVLISALLAAYFVRRSPPKTIPLHKKHYLTAVHLIETYTGQSRNTMGPREYVVSISPQLNTEVSELFRQITDTFIRCEYQSNAAKPDIKQLKTKIKRLKVVTHSRI